MLWEIHQSELRSQGQGKMGRKKNRRWRAYQPTPYDLERDPSLGKNAKAKISKRRKAVRKCASRVNWNQFRQFQTDEKRSVRVVENADGTWDVMNEDGIVLTEKSNAEAWRAVERLETRKHGRKSKLYQSDAATDFDPKK